MHTEECVVMRWTTSVDAPAESSVPRTPVAAGSPAPKNSISDLLGLVSLHCELKAVQLEHHVCSSPLHLRV